MTVNEVHMQQIQKDPAFQNATTEQIQDEVGKMAKAGHSQVGNITPRLQQLQEK